MAIEKIFFGRTGHESTRTLFGAAALSRVTQEVADETMRLVRPAHSYPRGACRV